MVVSGIYLGGAAGVGKTYQCLGDARLAAEEGVDLVIGYVEPHGRSATEERARALERAPLLGAGGGRAETEPDYRLAARAPAEVAIIDELAHTNAAARRPKRYEDVGGCSTPASTSGRRSTSSTSRASTAASRELTGVEVRETFPDRLVRDADEIRLVDLSPALAARADLARARLPDGSGRRAR